MNARAFRWSALALLPAVALTLTLTARAQQDDGPTQWNVDPVHSSVVFKIKHNDVAYFYGVFGQLNGTITTGGEPGFDLSVPVAGVETRNDRRDNHLKSPDFFNAEQFPVITFKSTGVQVDGDEHRVTGELTLLGVTRPIEVQVTRIGQGTDHRGTQRIGFDTQFTIKRSDFGMDFMLGALGDQVTLMIGIEATAAE